MRDLTIIELSAFWSRSYSAMIFSAAVSPIWYAPAWVWPLHSNYFSQVPDRRRRFQSQMSSRFGCELTSRSADTQTDPQHGAVSSRRRGNRCRRTLLDRRVVPSRHCLKRERLACRSGNHSSSISIRISKQHSSNTDHSRLSFSSAAAKRMRAQWP